MMLSIRDDTVISGSTINSPSTTACFYFSIEFLIGLCISGFLLFLSVVKSFLPKPPRNLTGDIVMITGATSSLGSLLAEEFARDGCSVICVDEEGSGVEATAERLRLEYPGIARAGPHDRKQGADLRPPRPTSMAYCCDLGDRESIKTLARKIRQDVGSLDVLVTCTGHSGQPVFDTVAKTLMSHYWTMMAFLPAMLHREKAHIIGVTPALSTEDAYMGSKAAVAGLIESLGQHFSGRNNRLTFMTVAPKAEPSLLKQSEKEIAKEVVLAVKRDLSCINMGWSSKVLYHLGCKLYDCINTISKWFYS